MAKGCPTESHELWTSLNGLRRRGGVPCLPISSNLPNYILRKSDWGFTPLPSVPVRGEEGRPKMSSKTQSFSPPRIARFLPSGRKHALAWCRGGESNSHISRYRILNPACLPIPPPRLNEYPCKLASPELKSIPF